MRHARDCGASLVARNRTNLKTTGAGEVEGGSPSLAEHFPEKESQGPRRQRL